MAGEGKNGTTSTIATVDDSLTLDEFLIGRKPKTRLVPTPEFERTDGTIPKVLIRALTAGEQDQIAAEQTQTLNVDERTLQTKSRGEDLRARVCQWCVLDPRTEKPLFSPKNIFDLQQADASIISRWYAIVLQLSQVTAEEVEKVVNLFQRTRDET